MNASLLLLTVVALSRLFELVLSARHEAALRKRGAFEIGAAHYPVMIILHASWLGGLFWLAHDAPISLPWLIIFLLLQAGRIWTLFSLGERWTTKIIILPHAPLVKRGPYSFVRHPNYVIVVGEIAVLPLCFGMTIYALLFSVANALMLTVRIQAEDEGLRRVRSGDTQSS